MDKKTNVVITGFDGQLASSLARVFESDWKVFGFDRKDMDVTDRGDILKKFSKIKPELVINTAALCNVEECESMASDSMNVNSVGAYNVSFAAKQINAAIVYISTDYVFDGSKKYFTEGDRPNPLNVYGISKLAGEQLTQAANEKSYIVRTSALFGFKKDKSGNFVYNILKNAGEQKVLRVVSNLITCPTFTDDLAEKIKKLIGGKFPFGVYHVTNKGYASWYQFASKIAEIRGFKARIKAINYASQIGRAKRPLFSVLKDNKTKKLGLGEMPTWQNALQRFLDQSRF